MYFPLHSTYFKSDAICVLISRWKHNPQWMGSEVMVSTYTNFLAMKPQLPRIILDNNVSRQSYLVQDQTILPQAPLSYFVQLFRRQCLLPLQLLAVTGLNQLAIEVGISDCGHGRLSRTNSLVNQKPLSICVVSPQLHVRRLIYF